MASEDFGLLWSWVGMFRQCTGSSGEMIQRLYAKAKKEGKLSSLPTNHNPAFAPSHSSDSRDRLSRPSLLRRMRGWPREQRPDGTGIN